MGFRTHPGVFIVSIICHWVVLPSAAWNHNALLVIFAFIIPMIVLHEGRKRGIVPALNLTPQQKQSSVIKFTLTTIAIVVIFWNQWWFLILALLAFQIVRIMKDKR